MAATSDEIKAVEDRIEKRRELIGHRLDDVKHELTSKVSRATRSWPVFAVAGGLAAGFAISRVGRHRVPAHAAMQYVPMHAAHVPPSHAHPRVRATGALAAILGLAATGLRIGMSSEARLFYNAVRRFRERRRHH
jgi:hypothetical protein